MENTEKTVTRKMIENENKKYLEIKKKYNNPLNSIQHNELKILIDMLYKYVYENAFVNTNNDFFKWVDDYKLVLNKEYQYAEKKLNKKYYSVIINGRKTVKVPFLHDDGRYRDLEVNIVAVYDEVDGLRELYTGVPLMKIDDNAVYSCKYYYYNELNEITEKEASNWLGIMIDHNCGIYYEQVINSIRGDIIEYGLKNAKKVKERKKESEKSLERLRNYNPKKN